MRDALGANFGADSRRLQLRLFFVPLASPLITD